MFIQKNIIIFRSIILIVLICFTGCVTSKIEYVEKEKLPEEKRYQILSVYLNDGSFINLKDKKPEVKLKHNGSNNVIVYYEEGFNEKYIPFNNISWLKIEIVETNQVVTAIVIAGAVVIALFLLFVVAIAAGFRNMH